jgi:opacity protein-like surface antigen
MRSYLLAGACAASLLLALTPVAQAADIEVAPEPMGLGWYVSVFGGWSHAKDESGHFSSSAYYFDLELDDGFTAGIAVGAQINEWLRGEVELSGNWHDAEGAIDTSVPPTTTTLDGDETALFALANLWLEVPIGLGPLRPYAGGGVGFGRLDLDIETSGGSTLFDDADWGFAWQLGAGVAFDVSESIAIDLGYRYKRIENADIEVHDDWATGEEVEKDYKSHNFLVGLRFGF